MTPSFIISLLAGLSMTLLVVFALIVWVQYRSKFMINAKLSLDDMFLFIDPQRLFLVNMGTVVIVPVIIFVLTGALPLAVIAAVGIFFYLG